MSTYILLANPGWGSVIAEAAFAVAGIPVTVENVDMDDRTRLKSVNPLGQLPTVIMPDGRVLTESAAIVLHLADLKPDAGLAPPVDAPERTEFLRWLVVLVAGVYATFLYADTPSRWVTDETAQDELARKNLEYRCSLYLMLEREAARGPWFLGERFSALDIYICAMTRWRPRRAWFARNCPKLHAIALKADGVPALAEVWKRNFG